MYQKGTRAGDDHKLLEDTSVFFQSSLSNFGIGFSAKDPHVDTRMGRCL